MVDQRQGVSSMPVPFGGGGAVLQTPFVERSFGGNGGGGGGGGAGLGGAIFVVAGGTLTIDGNSSQTAGSVQGGAGDKTSGGLAGVDGAAFGSGIFFQGSASGAPSVSAFGAAIRASAASSPIRTDRAERFVQTGLVVPAASWHWPKRDRVR